MSTSMSAIARALAGLLLALLAAAPAGAQQPPKGAPPASPAPLGAAPASHRGAAAGRDCARCHTTGGWDTVKADVAQFEHKKTGFPLRGAHGPLACDRCHGGPSTRPPARTGSAAARNVARSACAACHADPHRGEQGADCERCHSERSFRADEALSKHRATRMPLTGAHATAECGACHLERGTGQYTALPTDCAACHLRDYGATTNPNHAASGFSTSCQECHRPTLWSAAKIFHDRFFPLTGAHKGAQCASCHPGGRYTGTPRDCFACHTSEFNAATDPNHAAGGLSTSCQQCHTTSAWEPSTFNHASVFALSGAHAAAPCASCHVNNRYAGTPKDCFACHASEYTATTNPNHAASGFSTSCLQCHSSNAWLPATFNHASVFPLTGAHATAACASCHPNGRYTGTPRDCFSCHQADYGATTNPSHATSGFGTDCQTCHVTSGWTPATFDHERFFPIQTGDHRRFRNDCNACHPNPANKSIFTCISCHDRPDMDSEHRNRPGYSYDDAACYRCHPQGRS